MLRTVFERFVDGAIILGAAIGPWLAGNKKAFWEGLFNLIVVISIICAGHLIFAVIKVGKEIATQPAGHWENSGIFGPDDKRQRNFVSDERPEWFQTKLCVLLLAALVLLTLPSVLLRRLSPLHEAEVNSAVPPVSISLQMDCSWNHLPLHIPRANTIHILRVHPGMLKLAKFDMGLFDDISSPSDRALVWPSASDGRWLSKKEFILLAKSGELANDFVDSCTLHSYTNGTLDEIAPTLLVDTPDKKRHAYPIPFDPLMSGQFFSFYVVNMCSRGALPDLIQWDDYAKVRVLGEKIARSVPLHFQKHPWPPNGMMIGGGSSFVWKQNNTCEWDN